MSRVLQPANPTQVPVLPGTQVVTQMNMSTAVNAGDYVYSTASGIGVAASSGTLGSYTVPMGGTLVSGALQTGTLASYQYGPVAQQGTYTGTTYTLGQIVTGPTSLNSVSNNGYSTASTALINGNFVFAYRTAANSYSFQIISPTGSVVAGPTSIASNVTDGTTQRICMASTQNGGFLVGYFPTSGTNLVVQLYTSSGSLISTNNISISPSSSNSAYFLNVMQLANGNFAYCYVVTSVGYYGVVDSSFSTVLSPTFIDSTYCQSVATSYMLRACALVGGGFVISWFDGSYSYQSQAFGNTGVKVYSTAKTTGTIFGSSYGTVGICATQDGGFALTWNSSTQYAARYLVGTSTFTSSGASTVDASASQTIYPTCIFSTQNDNLGVFYVDSSLYPYVNISSSSSYSSTTWGTRVALNGTTVSPNYMSINGNYGAPTGKAGFLILGTSSYPSYVIVSTVAVTNGQSLTGANLAPPQYVFQGVSLNTVSANQTANVVINGTATLNSNYPSLTTQAPFDYSGQSQFGNVGFVYGRTVTMRGLE